MAVQVTLHSILTTLKKMNRELMKDLIVLARLLSSHLLKEQAYLIERKLMGTISMNFTKSQMEGEGRKMSQTLQLQL